MFFINNKQQLLLVLIVAAVTVFATADSPVKIVSEAEIAETKKGLFP